MVTLEINDKSKQAKKVIELLQTFDFVHIVENPQTVKNGKKPISSKTKESPYNEEFVKKNQRS